MKKDLKTEQEKVFFVEQIEKTKEIVKRFSQNEEFSPAMLINSLLSLVILPFERAKKTNGERVFPGKYLDLEKKLGFSPAIFQPIKCCDGAKVKYSNKTIYSFINKFRNGIAHQNLGVYVDNNKVIYISVYNVFICNNFKNCKIKTCFENCFKGERNTIIDFKITVTIQELQKLALYIANSYLKSID